MGSKIEWTDETWNPVTGCTKISTGCLNCYAERMAKRQKAMGNYADGFRLTLRPGKLDQPLRWRKPRRIFVCSMADLFHEGVPFEFIAAVFGVTAACPRHTLQILTKRADRMLAFFRWLEEQCAGWASPWQVLFQHSEALLPAKISARLERDMNSPWPWPLPNVWLGVTTENQATWDWRVEALRQCPASVRFVSVEPMLGPIDPCLFHWRKHLHWIICGGESGPGARPMHPDWVRSLRDQCDIAEVPFLFKQWGAWGEADSIEATGIAHQGWFEDAREDGGVSRHEWPGPKTGSGIELKSLRPIVYRVGKKAAGRELDGVIHDGYPEVTR